MKTLILITFSSLIIVQILTIFLYYKKIIIVWLDGGRNKFYRETDRWLLVISITFIFSSIYIFKHLKESVLNNEYNSVVYGLDIIILTVILIFSFKKINPQNKEIGINQDVVIEQEKTINKLNEVENDIENSDSNIKANQTDSRKSVIINKNKTVIRKVMPYFNQDFSENLYKRLVDNDLIEFINQENTDRLDIKEFIYILNSGITPEKPMFRLKMDNIETKFFWDLLSNRNNKFTLNAFLEIFKNNNKSATRSSIEASASKATNEPKNKQAIENCLDFDKRG